MSRKQLWLNSKDLTEYKAHICHVLINIFCLGSNRADVVRLNLRNRFRLKVQVIVWQGEAQTCFEASHTLKVDQVIGSLIGLIIILKMVILNMTNMTDEMPASPS